MFPHSRIARAEITARGLNAAKSEAVLDTSIEPAENSPPSLFSRVRNRIWEQAPAEDRTLVFYIVRLAALFAAYFLTGYIGLSIGAVNTFAAPLWAPSGIALAALIVYGIRLWPAVAIGAFLLNFISGAHPLAALGIGLGNTLEPVVGALLLRAVGFNEDMRRIRDMIAIIGVAIFVTALTSATIGVTSLYIAGSVPPGTYFITWATWWLGDALSVLILCPFLIAWLGKTRTIITRITRTQFIENTAIFATVGLVTFLMLWIVPPSPAVIPGIYMIYIPLIWVALRSGTRGVVTALLFVLLISFTGIHFGHGRLAAMSIHDATLTLQYFIGTMALMFLVLVASIEERKKALQASHEYVISLERALDTIRSEDQAKTDFLAVLAHELRNPMAPIVSTLEIFKNRAYDRHNVSKLVEGIEVHVQTIKRLLDDLLDVSRITRKKMRLSRETVTVQEIINRARETVEAFFSSRKHEFSIVMPKDALWIHVDQVRLTQVIVNLLVNAAKYTPAGGSITLSAIITNGLLKISVKDTGIGIPPDMLKRIFEPFVQVHAKPSEVGLGGSMGMGVGLSLTKRLVELHGGTIHAESRGKDTGSEFIVQIPLPDNVQLPLLARKQQRDMRRPARSRMPNKPFKILVIDDNEAAAEGLGTLLSFIGHEVRLGHDGATALDIVATFDPDVVILDIGLPEMDGYTVARTLREQKRTRAKLIALSGYGQEADKLKAREAGFVHHLVKPASIEDIQHVLLQLAEA